MTIRSEVPRVRASRKQHYHHGDLRNALLGAALDLIGEHGPSGLGIREVARRAGVSHSAPYRHFRDRDALIVAVVEQGLPLLNETTKRCIAEAGDAPPSQFASGGLAYIDFALEHPNHYRVMFSGNLLSGSGGELLKHTSEDALAHMVESTRQCQHLGLIRAGDPLPIALTIWSTIHGFVSLLIDRRLELLVGGGDSLARLRDAVLTAMFEGIGAPLPARPPAETVMHA